MQKRTIMFFVSILAVLVSLSGCTKNKSAPEATTDPAPAAAPSEPAPAEPSAPAATAPAEPSAPTDGKPVKVEMTTNMGTVTMELYPDKAPKTVKNFLSYVSSGFYKGTIFHRVIDGFMIQGGGFDKSLSQKETQGTVENEADNGLKNEVGTVAMARTPDPHSASAQFFINVSNNEFLNHRDKTQQGWGYCVFGKVLSGMEVVNKIKALPTGGRGPFPSDVPQTDVIITDMKVL